jgi:hypothetical protein
MIEVTPLREKQITELHRGEKKEIHSCYVEYQKADPWQETFLLNKDGSPA